MNDSSAGIKLLAAVIGFWVIMRAVNKDASGRTLVDHVLGTSGKASTPLPSVASIAASTPAGGVTNAPVTPAASASLQALNQAKVTQLTGGRSGGFTPDPGTNFQVGEEPQIASALTRLGAYLHENIVGISGYRTPAHSVAVGGSAIDPHTGARAADIGVNSQLRSSAASIPERVLAMFGLWRPFDPSGAADNSEVNHIELIGQS